MTHSSLCALLVAISACGTTDSEPTVVRTTHVETHPSQGPQRIIEPATASLEISSKQVVAELSTRELSPGHAYTLWFVVVNTPAACASRPCTAADILKNTDTVQADARWAAGAIADESGTLDLKARIETGTWPHSWFRRGLTNPMGAEIHLVLNDHGPVIAGREQTMTTTYRDGCTDESLPPPFPQTAKSDGLAGPNKCALVQDAIFTVEL